VELDVVGVQVLLRLHRGLVDGGDRRAAVAGDVAGGVQARLQVALALEHGQADQGLRAGHERAAAFERPLVVEGNLVLVLSVLGQRQAGALDGCVHGCLRQLSARIAGRAGLLVAMRRSSKLHSIVLPLQH